MVKMARIFDIEEIPEPRKPLEKHEIVMNIRKEWYNLRWKKEILDRYPPDHVVLDATLLNEFVLRDIIGIQDVRTDTRIFYVDGSKGLEGLRKTTQENDDRVGFLMHPVDFDDLMKMADTGESLPPKSTYFEPRMKSGMLVKML